MREQPPFKKKQRGFINIFPPAVVSGGSQSNATFISVTTTGAGSVTSPAWAQAIEIILQAAGGGTPVGGSGTSGPRCGGGSGEYTRRIIPCTPSTLYNFSVGASAVATDGGDTTFTGDTTVWTARGGKQGTTATGGNGGGRLGGAGGAAGGAAGVAGGNAVAEGLESYSGAGGGGAGNSTGTGAPGGACEENAGGTPGAGAGAGGGGGASKFGPGGNGGANGVAGGAPLATSYGAGAGGPGLGAASAGASGAKGLLMYRFI